MGNGQRARESGDPLLPRSFAWQRGFGLGVAVHHATERFPDDERFALTSQPRRAAVSVAGSIAEGYGRGSRADSARFLKVASGSLNEVETQLLFAREFQYLTASETESVTSKCQEAARVLSGLMTKLDGDHA